MSGKKFRTNIDLAEIVEPGEPEPGDLRLSANASDALVLTNSAGISKTILDSGDIPIPISMGGTGADDAADARDNLGLGTVAVEDVVPIGKGGTGLSALGTAGQVLTVNGTAAAAHWQDVPQETPASIKTKYESNEDTNAYTDDDVTAVASIQDKLDKQAVYSSAGVTSTFFHESDGGGYLLTASGDDSASFIGGNADQSSPIKLETYAKVASTDVGTRLIQTLDKIYYTAGQSDANYSPDNELATVADIPTALSQLTNDGNFVTDSSYVHTDNNFTTAEKTKLAGLDDNHFKGSYPSLAELEAAHPTASDGDYAYVGVAGTDAVNYIWDATDEQWVAGSSPTAETPASIKTKYESNDDTNAYTDDDAAAVVTIGDVADLTTSEKSTVVAAVNELVGTFASYVPTSRTINSKSLGANITLSNGDIGSEPALASGTSSQYFRGDKSWQDFGTSVRGTVLTGLDTSTNSPIAATDTTLAAFGKLQAQVGAIEPGAGDYVKLASVTISSSVVYLSFLSILNDALYDCYALYFTGLIPGSSNAGLYMHFVSGSTPRNGTSDNITFNSWAYGTTSESAETIGKYIVISGLPVSTVAQSSNTPGATGSMFIAATNSAASKAQVIGSAIATSPAGGFATRHSFAGGLNAPYAVDGFRLFFSAGNLVAGTATLFGVKK